MLTEKDNFDLSKSSRYGKSKKKKKTTVNVRFVTLDISYITNVAKPTKSWVVEKKKPIVIYLMYQILSF
jgi:hypothetical protein